MNKNPVPWQGIVLGIFAIISAIITLALTITFLAGGNIISSVFSSLATVGVPGFISSLATTVGIICLLFMILYIFMAIGIFKGQKWSIVVYLILMILGVLFGIGFLASEVTIYSSVNFLVHLILGIFSIQMLKNPYYNNK
ncbi:MAG: hypothetical protein NTZ80_02040 [Patescibacteria group bacterium]|nr:hypothetical protein [Patescibacteria group bacterium]